MDDETRRCIDDLRQTSSDTRDLINQFRIMFAENSKDIKRISDVVEKYITDHEERLREVEGQEVKCTIMITTMLKNLEEKHDTRLRELENWKHTMIGKLTAVVLLLSGGIAVATSWVLSKF